MVPLRARPHLTSTRCARTCVIWPRRQTLMEAPFRWRTARSSVSIARRSKAGAAWTAWHIPRTGSPGNRPWPAAARGLPQIESKRGHELNSHSSADSRLSTLSFLSSKTLEVENRDAAIIDADELILDKTLQCLVDTLTRQAY